MRERDSLDRQEEKAHQHAAKNNWTLLHVWLEMGESAKTDDRTELWKMHDWCKRHVGQVSILIIPKIDRFARNSEDYHDLKRKFRKLGIRIASVDEQIDDTPEGHLQENVFAAFAQFDNERRAERAKDGMVEAARAGRWVWKAPYGYRNVKEADSLPNIASFGGEARIMKTAFTLVGNRTLSPAETFELLKGEGLPMSRSAFYAALRNPIYAGFIRAFGSEARGSFAPIVEEPLFYSVQEVFARSCDGPTSYALDNVDFPLRGTIRCGKCGNVLTASWSKGRNERYGYYHCLQCKRVNHPKDEVEHAFVHRLNSYALPEPYMDAVIAKAKSDWTERNRLGLNKRDRIARRKAEVLELQKALALKSAQGILPDDIVRAQIDDLRREIAELDRNYAETDKIEVHLVEMLEFGRDLVVAPGRFWERSDLSCKKRLREFLFCDGLVYDGNGIFRTFDIRLLSHNSNMVAMENPGWWTIPANLRTIAEFCRDIGQLYLRLGGASHD